MAASEDTTGTGIGQPFNFETLRDIQRTLFASAPRFDTIIGSANLRKLARSEEFVARDAFGLPSRPESLKLRTLYGYQVHEVAGPGPRRPVLQISPDFPHVSDEFRASWNAWAIDRFGTEEVAYLVDSGLLRSIFANVSAQSDRLLASALLFGAK